MLEGNTNETYWDWKDSLGPLRNRPGKRRLAEIQIPGADCC